VCQHLDKTLLLLFMVDSALNIVFWGFVSLLFLWGWLPGVGAAEPGSTEYQLCVQDPDCNPADAVNGTSDDFHFLEVLGACGLTALLTVRLPPLPSTNTCLCDPRCPRCVHSCRSPCAESVPRGGVGAQCGCLSGYRLYRLPVVTSDMPKVNI